MECEYHQTCGFIESTKSITPLTVTEVEMVFCNDDKLECVRYCLQQVLEGYYIPDELWPNDESGALDVIKIKIRNEKIKSALS